MLDDAIAGAVTEYQRLRERSRDRDATERLGYLAHELRNKVHTAMLAYGVLKQGQLGLGGSTGAVLGRGLGGLQDLITQSLAEVRVDAGVQHRERVEVSEIVEELEAEASMAANAAGRKLSANTYTALSRVTSHAARIACSNSSRVTGAWSSRPPHVLPHPSRSRERPCARTA